VGDKMRDEKLSVLAKNALVQGIDSIVEKSEDPFLSRTLLFLITKHGTYTFLSTTDSLDVDRSVVKDELKRLTDSGLITVSNKDEGIEAYQK
jgi:hypothetical protein